MKFEVQLLGVSMSNTGIMSIKLKASKNALTEDIRDGLRETKDIQRKISINDINIYGVVKSLSYGSGENILIHAQINKYAINKMADWFISTNNVFVVVTLLSKLEETLLSLLEEAKGLLNENAENMLYRISSFVNSNGRQIEGVKSIFHANRKRQLAIERGIREIINGKRLNA